MYAHTAVIKLNMVYGAMYAFVEKDENHLSEYSSLSKYRFVNLFIKICFRKHRYVTLLNKTVLGSTGTIKIIINADHQSGLKISDFYVFE